jgi:hypothetical protein
MAALPPPPWPFENYPPGEAGPEGPQGPQGEPGEDGAPGPSNILHESSGPTDLAVGAILNKEVPAREGSTFVGRVNRTIAQSADVTEASAATAVDVPGLTIDLPRAGTYHVQVLLHSPPRAPARRRALD